MARRKKLKSTFWFEYLTVSLVALTIGIITSIPRSSAKFDATYDPTEHSPALKSSQWILEKESIQYIIKTKMDDDTRNPGLDKGREES
jgi:hypothetical protein